MILLILIVWTTMIDLFYATWSLLNLKLEYEFEFAKTIGVIWQCKQFLTVWQHWLLNTFIFRKRERDKKRDLGSWDLSLDFHFVELVGNRYTGMGYANGHSVLLNQKNQIPIICNLLNRFPIHCESFTISLYLSLFIEPWAIVTSVILRFQLHRFANVRS